MAQGLRTSNSLLDFPGANFDVSSLMDFGNVSHAPTDFSVGAPVLPTQYGAAGTGSFEPSFMQSMMGWTDPASGIKTMGFAGPAMSGLSSLVSGFMGMSALKEARAARAQQQKQFDMNYGAQRTLTNSMLEDRQRARVASNPGAYQSVGDYMTQNKVA